MIDIDVVAEATADRNHDHGIALEAQHNYVGATAEYQAELIIRKWLFANSNERCSIMPIN